MIPDNAATNDTGVPKFQVQEPEKVRRTKEMIIMRVVKKLTPTLRILYVLICFSSRLSVISDSL